MFYCFTKLFHCHVHDHIIIAMTVKSYEIYRKRRNGIQAIRPHMRIKRHNNAVNRPSSIIFVLWSAKKATRQPQKSHTTTHLSQPIHKLSNYRMQKRRPGCLASACHMTRYVEPLQQPPPHAPTCFPDGTTSNTVQDIAPSPPPWSAQRTAFESGGMPQYAVFPFYPAQWTRNAPARPSIAR